MNEKVSADEPCIRGFYVLSEAWYGKTLLRTKENVHEEIWIGLYHPAGGSPGEFVIRWTALGGKSTPCLEAYGSAWRALGQFKDLLRFLEYMHAEGQHPAVIVALLKQIGCKDLTERRDPKPGEVPVCHCCRQPLPVTSEER